MIHLQGAGVELARALLRRAYNFGRINIINKLKKSK
jgi:hypothetical protein